MTLTDSEAEYINIAKKRTALQIQTLNRISGLPDLEPTSPISADNKINFSSRQACPERTLSKVENVRPLPQYERKKLQTKVLVALQGPADQGGGSFPKRG